MMQRIKFINGLSISVRSWACGHQICQAGHNRTFGSTTHRRSMATDKIRSFKLEGLTSPPVTAFKPNGDLNLEITADYVKHFQKYGIRNTFVTGTTSEGSSLTIAERKLVAESWVREGKQKLSAILIHIGAGNLRESQELAAHAQEIGADAIACVGPTYHRPETLEQYVFYMRDVAAAAPDLPFYLYDIDFFTHIPWTGQEFFRLADSHIPTLRGTKHTSMDFISMMNLVTTYGDKYQILMGSDDCYLEGLSAGLHGTVCNSFSGGALTRMKAAFDRGDIQTARQEQQRAFAIGELRRKYKFSFPGGAKAILRAMGLEVGDPRCPLEPVTNETVAALKQDLEKIGFFQWGHI